MIKRTQILSLVGLAAALLLGATHVQAKKPHDKGSNTILRIERQESADVTRIRIHCARPPTFTSFRLQDPIRIFVDIARGDITKVRSTLVVENGVVDRVGTLRFRRNGEAIGRVIIGLNQQTVYDIRREGRTIEILIDASHRKSLRLNEGGDIGDVKVHRETLRQLQQAIDTETSKITALHSQRKKLVAERARLKKETEGYEDRFSNLGNLEKNYRNLEQKLAQAKSELEATKGRHGALQDAVVRLKRVESDRDKLHSELRHARHSQLLASQSLSGLTESLKTARADLAQREAAILQSQIKTKRLNKENRALSTRISDAEQRAGTVEATLSSSRKSHDQRLLRIQREVYRLRDDVARAEKKITAQKRAGRHQAKETRALTRLKASLKRQLNEERTAQRQRENDLKAHVEQLNDARKQLRDALSEQKLKQHAMNLAYKYRVTSLEARIKSLHSLREKQEKAARARAVLTAKTQLTAELERLAQRKHAESKVVEGLTKQRNAFEMELQKTKKVLTNQKQSVRAIQATTVVAQTNLQTTQKRLSDAQKKYQVLVHKRSSLREEVEVLQERADTLRAQRQTKIENMAQLQKENSRLSSRVHGLEDQLQKLQEELTDARQNHHLKIAKLSAERTILQTRIRSHGKRSTKKAHTYASGLKKLRKDRKALQRKVKLAQERQRKNIAAIESERDRLRAEVRALQSKHPGDAKRIARLRALLLEVQQQAAASRLELEKRAQGQVAMHKKRIEHLKRALKKRDNRKQTRMLKKELRRERHELAKSRTLHKKLTAEYRAAHVAARKAKKEFQELREKIVVLQKKLDNVDQKHNQAIKSVKSERNKALDNATDARTLAASRTLEARRLRNEADALRAQLKSQDTSDLRKRYKAAETAAGTARAGVTAANQVGLSHLVRAERLKTDLTRLQTKLDLKSAQITALKTSLTQVQKNHSQPAQISDIRFEHTEQGPRIIIQANRALSYEMKESAQVLDLTLENVVLPGHLERVLDTRAFHGPIVEVATYRDAKHPTRVHVEITRQNGAQGGIIRSGEKLVWAFRHENKMIASSTQGNPDVRWSAHGVAAASYGSGPNTHPNTGGSRSQTVGGALGGIGLPPKNTRLNRGAPGSAGYQYVDPYLGRRRQKRKYSGRKVNLTIKDADILHVLTFLAKEGGINIITSQNVTGSVSFHFENVHWLLALEMVLKSKGLDYVEEDGVYRIALADEIQKEYERELEKRKKLNEFKQLVVKLIPLNYASATDMKKRVKEILSSKGTVGVDNRTNTLIVKDVEEHVVAAEDLVMRLDTQTPQVLIEARIVEASDNFSRELGIQWGGGYTMAPMYGNETGLMFPGSVGIAGGADDPQSPLTGLMAGDQPNFAVNMPAAAGLGSGGALSLSLASINGAGTLNLRLSAAEEAGSVKIISSPRVATMDNQEAVIEQGVSIPISVVSANGVNTQFFQADLRLNVTPHVTPDGNISMQLQITKNEPDFGTRGSDGNPTIQRKEARTQLLVKDGETAVIGGIFTRNTALSRKSVPFFGDLPLLGWLFRSSSKVDKRSELLIFVTPRIVNREASKPKTGP